MKSIWLLILLVSCMTWRQANLGWESSWGNNQEVLLYSIEFEERNSWNPLEGTTIKKNYKTRLQEYKFISNKLEKQNEWEFPFWVFGNHLFYNSEKKLIFLIRGQEGSGYGTENRILSIYKIADKNLENLWSSREGEYLWKIVPSPDTSKILFLTTENATSQIKAKLHIWDGKFRSVKISSWLDASFEHAVSWNEDSKSIFLAQPEGVYKIDLQKPILELQKAKEFPKCFVPSTSFGFRISNDKKEVHVDPSKGANFTTVVHEKFIPYEKIPKTTQFQNRECEFVN